MNPTILVITGDAAWTRRAIHLAAAMARDAAGEWRIIYLLPVARLEDLGANAREEWCPRPPLPGAGRLGGHGRELRRGGSCGAI